MSTYSGGGIYSYAGERRGALQNIPKSRNRLTPVYLGATAGMRLLNISNPTESEQILKDVGSKLRTYSFDFRGETILSGQEEGAYGWVNVNYLLDNFIKVRFSHPGRDTVGALDFGGTSTQITFETTDVVEDKSNVLDLRLYGRDDHPYTQSFLCYGRDQVLRRLLAHLVKTQGAGPHISHPYYPAGFNVSMKLDKVFESPCTADQRPSPYSPQVSLTVMGTGNYQQCLGNMSKLFFLQGQIEQSLVSSSPQAFSAFLYTHVFLKRTTGITVTSPILLEGAVCTVCNMSFQEMLGKAPDHWLPCLFGRCSAGDTSFGWALVYMLCLSNLLPGESTGLRKPLPPKAWSCLIFLFVLPILVAPGYLLLKTYQKKKGSSSLFFIILDNIYVQLM
uniref:Ectonucleoside triphosphate diphosphohydrolase 2 n=1 Tax=Oncorhynchus kisutch TaxID=8019 RepID=A0A8C7J2X7_ONCKI